MGGVDLTVLWFGFNWGLTPQQQPSFINGAALIQLVCQ